MAYFTKHGTTFSVIDSSAVEISTKLPAGNYVVRFNDIKRFFLEQIEDFKLPEKMHGNDIETKTTRVLTTFNARPNNTGVLLVGEKGSGKTLLAKNIAIELGKAGLPTILINEPHFGDEFNTFISSIDQPCVVFFDEFEKVYDNDDENSEQDRMLSLLDGVFTSKKLFLLTANDQFKISKYIINRPGRVFYTFKYAGLTDEFIREFCDEKLNEKSHIEDILKFTMCVSAFNFDALNAVVEELNRYGGDFASVIDYLNLETDLAGTSFYEVELYQDGQRVPDHAMYEPLMRLRLTDRHDSNIRIDMREGYKDSFFTERDLIAMDYTTKTYTYENSKKEKVILKKLGSFRFGAF